MFTSAQFCRNPHQFYRCIKEERTVPRRKPLGSAFFLFVIQVFLSKQSSRPNGQNGGALGSTAARSTVTSQSADGTIYVQGTSDVTVTVSSCTTQIDTTGSSTVGSWNSCAAGSRPRFAAAYPPPRNAFSALFKAAIQSGLDLKPFTKKHLRRLPGSTGAFFAFRIYKSHSAAGLSSTPLTALHAFSRWVQPVPAVRSPSGNHPHRTECTG